MNQSHDLVLITGNRSGDLDSLVSSYVKGTLLSLKEKKNKQVFILFHFPEKEWKLHPEAQFLFRGKDIFRENIIFLDDLKTLNLEKLSEEDRLQIILTDHNRPEEILIPFAGSIVEIIDHHEVVSPLAEKIQKVIHNTGSCSTLVAEQFLEELKRNPASFSQNQIPFIADLLYFTIRIDTDHLEENTFFDLQKDRHVLERLLPHISLPEQFLNQLRKKKMDFSDFTLEDHFSKDFKAWESGEITYGISTVYIDRETFFTMEKSSPSAEKFLKKKRIGILFLMHFLKEPILKRELTVFIPGVFPYKEEILKAISDSDLFEDIQWNSNENMYFFSQLDPRLSRKKIQPFIEALLKEIKDLK
ncbi:MAG: DHH family phosphoesterase [Spirochaetaceae bacterium]|nr:DHH family phosphoesterase [Spirochaetaceae bacterium]